MPLKLTISMYISIRSLFIFISLFHFIIPMTFRPHGSAWTKKGTEIFHILFFLRELVFWICFLIIVTYITLVFELLQYCLLMIAVIISSLDFLSKKLLIYLFLFSSVLFIPRFFLFILPNHY